VSGMSRQVEGKIARRLMHQVNPARVILCAELVATLPAYPVWRVPSSKIPGAEQGTRDE